ncbi:Uncharacterised protein [Escherichia coli]|nr:Uncharacterised protein [Escherichia coli]
MINGAIVPVIHKQGVSKTQRQQVQHRFFTKIVVDTVNLALLEVFANLIMISCEVASDVPSGFSMTTRAGLAFSLASPSLCKLRQKWLGGMAK